MLTGVSPCISSLGKGSPFRMHPSLCSAAQSAAAVAHGWLWVQERESVSAQQAALRGTHESDGECVCFALP